jgi:hypothetical protein
MANIKEVARIKRKKGQLSGLLHKNKNIRMLPLEKDFLIFRKTQKN